MANKPNYIPEGYRAITPYLIVRGGAKAIDYYVKVFGAKELMRMEGQKDGLGTPNCRLAIRTSCSRTSIRR